MERAFLLSEISKSKTKLEYFCLIYLKLWSKIRQFLSYFDWICFCQYFANIELIKQKQIRTKHFNTINWLRRQCFALLRRRLPTPVIPKHVFIALMKTATTSVEFSFNNILYRQIDGVAMGSLVCMRKYVLV